MKQIENKGKIVKGMIAGLIVFWLIIIVARVFLHLSLLIEASKEILIVILLLDFIISGAVMSHIAKADFVKSVLLGIILGVLILLISFVLNYFVLNISIIGTATPTTIFLGILIIEMFVVFGAIFGR